MNVPPISVGVDITAKQLAGLVISAIEGGINYWCKDLVTDKGDDSIDLTELRSSIGYGAEYPVYAVVGNDYALLLLEDKEGDGPDVWHTLDRAALEKGLGVMAAKYPWHFADILRDNYDCTTADVLVQSALFGEVVYG